MQDKFTGGMGILQPTNIGVEMDKLAVKKKSGAFGDILEYVVKGINTTAHDSGYGTNDIIFTQNRSEKTVKILTITSGWTGFSVSSDIESDILFFEKNDNGSVIINNSRYNVVLVKKDDLEKLKLKGGRLTGMPNGDKLEGQNSFNDFFSEQGE